MWGPIISTKFLLVISSKSFYHVSCPKGPASSSMFTNSYLFSKATFSFHLLSSWAQRRLFILWNLVALIILITSLTLIICAIYSYLFQKALVWIPPGIVYVNSVRVETMPFFPFTMTSWPESTKSKHLVECSIWISIYKSKIQYTPLRKKWQLLFKRWLKS